MENKGKSKMTRRKFLLSVGATMTTLIAAKNIFKDNVVYSNSVTGNTYGSVSTSLINVKSPMFGAKGDGFTDDTQAIQKAINSLPGSGGEVYFPQGTYLVNSTITVLARENIKLSGYNVVTILVDGFDNFLNIINSTNIEVNGFLFKDKNYKDNVYFKEIALNTSTMLFPNVNNHLSIVESNPIVTISSNENTPFQTVEYHSVLFNIDSSKEHTLQTFDGIVSGENGGTILVRKYTSPITFKEYKLDYQNQDSSSPGYYRWHSNYIEKGITKIELLLPYSKIHNSDNNPLSYDLSKIRLFQAVVPLPDSSDLFNVSLQNSKGIIFRKNVFIGMKRNTISSLYVNENIWFVDNHFENCLIGHIQISNMKECLIENNKFIISLSSDTGREVFYTKACTRAISGNKASTNVTIRNNYGNGLYIGAEIWHSTNLIISRLLLDNVYWGLSICNNSTATISNCAFNMRDNYRYVLEIAQNTKVDVDSIRVKGRSYIGLVFSMTQNTAGPMNISNIYVDSCFLFCQFTDDSLYFKNIEVKEVMSIGILALQGGDYSESVISLDHCNFAFSKTLQINNPSYTASFIRINQPTKYIKKVILSYCNFMNKSCKQHFDIMTTEISMQYVKFYSLTIYNSLLFLKDTNYKSSSISYSQLYDVSFMEFYRISPNSRLLIMNNTFFQTTLPNHDYVITYNNKNITLS